MSCPCLFGSGLKVISHWLAQAFILLKSLFKLIAEKLLLSAVVDVNNIKRARYTLQITLCSLFNQLREDMPNNLTDLSPYGWLSQKSKDSTSFLYWKCVIDLQVLILLYVRSIWEGNFKLHVEVLFKLLICICFFIFDHCHYARWLSVHTVIWLVHHRIEIPQFVQLFFKRNFSFQKSNREFSRMGLD